jgi:hypothetical protein
MNNQEIRHAKFQLMGEMRESLAPIISNNIFQEFLWPIRESWQVITRGSQHFIFSDGLSDEFPEEDECEGDRTIGFGLELAIQVDSKEKPEDDPRFIVLRSACDVITENYGVDETIKNQRVISLELSNADFPKELCFKKNTVMILLDIDDKNLPSQLVYGSKVIPIAWIKILNKKQANEILKSHNPRATRLTIAQELRISR